MNEGKQTQRKTSLKWKLMIMYIALVFMVIIISGTFIILTVKSNFETASRSALEGYTNRLYKDIEPYIKSSILSEDDYEQLDNIFKTTSLSNSQANLIAKRTGKTLFSNATSDRSEFQNYSNSVVAAAFNGSSDFQSGKYAEDINGTILRWNEYASPVKNENDEVIYAIYVRQNAADMFSSLSEITNTTIFSLILALAAAGALGMLFSSTITEPIKTLTGKAKELATGRLDKEIEVLSSDELGVLTESFNYMAKELNQTLSDMEREKNKMEIVLYNMTDGVLAYDSEGNLIHMNHICKELLNVGGKFPDLAEISFTELKERLKIEDESSEPGDSLTIKIGDKYLNTTFNKYYNQSGQPGGTIAVFQDITKHILLDNMRKEFVANVSHEIRTPLTTIRAYTETLLEGAADDPKTAVDFLKIIENETGRMTLLVQDLLELSKLDNQQMQFNFKPVNIVSLVCQNVKQQMITAEKQNKTISFSTTDDEMILTIDPERINQVLNNIISNSIKYSLSYTQIDVSLEKTEKYYRIVVSDNGIGIPKEDVRRIFERFYRVDKARSREMGGTGLGLSIAKEIMEAHGGRITASSEVGKGTTMVLRFPIASPQKDNEILE